MVNKLRAKLYQLGLDLSKNKFTDRLPTDLADIYSICAVYQSLIDKLLNLPQDDRLAAFPF
jgi:hypothetical protein